MMEFLTAHHLLGLTIGLCAFLCIGLFHPLVIKGEYYFGVKGTSLADAESRLAALKKDLLGE